MGNIDKKYVVRLYDGFDNEWMDLTPPIDKEEADKYWNYKTENGTKKTSFADIDYYRIFEADTKMFFGGESFVDFFHEWKDGKYMNYSDAKVGNK
jgi:hypothetical protein